jgi:hypothetical protein
MITNNENQMQQPEEKEEEEVEKKVVIPSKKNKKRNNLSSKIFALNKHKINLESYVNLIYNNSTSLISKDTFYEYLGKNSLRTFIEEFVEKSIQNKNYKPVYVNYVHDYSKIDNNQFVFSYKLIIPGYAHLHSSGSIEYGLKEESLKTIDMGKVKENFEQILEEYCHIGNNIFMSFGECYIQPNNTPEVDLYNFNYCVEILFNKNTNK